MSVTGVSCRSSALRSSAVSDNLLCNVMMKYSQEDPTVGLTIKSVLAWSSQAGPPMQICVAAGSEALARQCICIPRQVRCAKNCPKQGGKGITSTVVVAIEWLLQAERPVLEDRLDNFTDTVHWVVTAVVVADCLTDTVDERTCKV